MNTTKHLTANRCISAVLLLAMLLAMGIMLAGCNAAVVPDADPLPTARAHSYTGAHAHTLARGLDS